jgi:hypothetical protein
MERSCDLRHSLGKARRGAARTHVITRRRAFKYRSRLLCSSNIHIISTSTSRRAFLTLDLSLRLILTHLIIFILHNVCSSVDAFQAGTLRGFLEYLPTYASVLILVQASSAINALKMSDSPTKKLDFASADKENVFRPIVGIPDLPEDEAPVAKTGTAPTIKLEEAHEPLLQENPNRFVLFPIKYHDVGSLYNVFDASYDASTIVRTLTNTVPLRFGKCTRRPKLPSGQPRRLIYPRIFMTGTSD